MGEGLRPVETDLARRIADLERQVAELRRMPSGLNSLGIAHLRPATKSGTPSDADYPGSLPPVGSRVYDIAASKIWIRHGAGVWKAVVVA